MKRLKLNIQMFGASGSASSNIYCNASSTYPYTLSMSWTETGTSIDGNYSTISFSYSLYGKNIGFSTSNGGTLGFMYWDSNQNQWITAQTKQVTSLSKGSTVSGSGTFTIAHKADGTQYINCLAYWSKTGTSSYIPNYGEAKGNDTGLTTIPRASSISGGNCNPGHTSNAINISRASSSFTHTITWTFGGLSGTVCTKTSATSVTWNTPYNLYSQMPYVKEGYGTYTCYTYNGNTLVGTSTSTFYAWTVENECKPTASISVVDRYDLTKSLTGNENVLIKGVSTAKCTLSSSARQYSSLSSYTLNGIDVGSTNEYNFYNTNTDTYTYIVTDRRGYSTTVSTKKTIINYIPLTVSPTIERNQPTDGKINVTISGNYFNDTFGAVDNDLSVVVKYKEESSTEESEVVVPITISGNTYSGTTQISNCDYEKNFVFTTTATDKIKTVTTTTNVPKGQPVFWWNKQKFVLDKNISLQRDGKSCSWYKGRDNAMVKMPVLNGYSPMLSMKTKDGTWEMGAYDQTDNPLIFSYITDANHDSGTNTVSGQVKFTKDGCISLTGTGWIWLGGGMSYRKFGNFIEVSGISYGNYPVGKSVYKTMATLPEGCRPSTNIYFLITHIGGVLGQQSNCILPTGEIQTFDGEAYSYWSMYVNFWI